MESGEPQYRILVVEDEQENWLVLERLLSEAGFQVRVAQNGVQGVEIFSGWRPHFIWMDLRMPVMDGIEAARAIRSLVGGQDVKIAAVSAWGISRRTEVLAAGMDDYLTKPYRPDEIFDCLERHLGVRYLRAEAAQQTAGQAVELNKEAIAALPDTLRGTPRRGHHAQCQAYFERHRQGDRAGHMAGCIPGPPAEKYSYTAILSAVEDAQQEHGR